MKSIAAPEKGGPRVNRDIRAVQVQLIDAEGHNRGVTNLADAIKLAEDASLDLVEIVPNASPPVCKILDFGKFRFLEQKKSSAKNMRIEKPSQNFGTIKVHFNWNEPGRR